jgi:hypothetical protein
MRFRGPADVVSRPRHRCARQSDYALQETCLRATPAGRSELSMDIRKPHSPVAVSTLDGEERIPDAPLPIQRPRALTPEVR